MKSVMALLRWLDANIERVVVLICYSAMALIIVLAVIQRYFFSYQSAWSTTIPIYLFLWVTWVGASYNTKLRSHLNFNELRMRFSYRGQFACLVLDAVLWVVFGVIVTIYTTQQVTIVFNNFAIVQGTDNIMQWWFYAVTPIAWTLLIFRALQNLAQDIRTFRRREPFVHQVSLASE